MSTIAVGGSREALLMPSILRGRSDPVTAAPEAVHLSVLRGFELQVDGRVITVPSNVERMVAFLAVRERPQLRTKVAATLWMDTAEPRAAANLRTCLWKSRRALGEAVLVTGSYMALAASVDVDLSRVVAQAKRLIGTADDLRESDADAEALIGDLLPDWDEDWILFERERLRQLRVHALESLCRRLSASGRHGEAVDAGQAAVAAEPLRESAQRALIAAHLVEGNRCEARRQYEQYRELLREAMGIEPSTSLHAIVSSGCVPAG